MNQSPTQSTDILIAGSGMVGAAIAYFLTRHGFSGRILMVEKDLTFSRAATGLSAGGIRQQFSGPENIKLSQFTLALIRRLKEEFGPEADIGFHENGYSILASEKGLPQLATNIETQQNAGADVALLTPTQLAHDFSWMNVEGLAGASRSYSGEGWLDAHGLMNLLRQQARKNGAQLLRDEVTRVNISSNRVTHVELASGEKINCGIFINAAGPEAGSLAASAGIHLPVAPRKRFIFVLDCRDAPQALHQAPLTVDPSGFWFRPEGQQFICGKSPDEAEEPSVQDFEVDHSFFEEKIWADLAFRVPAFEAIKVVGAWAGHYDYNSLDQNGIIGPHPEITNFYFANGFSGHGMQQGAGVGNAIAEHIIKGHFATIDLGKLSYERILAHKPYPELNVI